MSYSACVCQGNQSDFGQHGVEHQSSGRGGGSSDRLYIYHVFSPRIGLCHPCLIGGSISRIFGRGFCPPICGVWERPNRVGGICIGSRRPCVAVDSFITILLNHLFSDQHDVAYQHVDREERSGNLIPAADEHDIE